MTHSLIEYFLYKKGSELVMFKIPLEQGCIRIGTLQYRIW